jgi:adenylate cyclase
MQQARFDESLREVETALQLEPDSYDANSAAARWNYLTRRFDEAIRYWEKAASMVESEYMAAGMLVSCYNAIGDREGARRAAQRSLARAEAIVAMEADNGSAMGHAFGALAALGEVERAKEWAGRAMLLDPENLNLRYNVACTLVSMLGDNEGALDILEPLFERMKIEAVHSARTDPDLDPIREHPRFKRMLDKAAARDTKA